MSKRGRIFVGLLLLLVLGLVVWRSVHPAEPIYEGKSVSQWLEGHTASSSANPPFQSPGWKSADAALRQLGTNALPTLLRMLRAQDPPRRIRQAREWMSRRIGIGRPYRYASQRHEEAEYAFQTLGTNAVSAVPELIRIYEENLSPSSQHFTALSLAHIGPGARAALPVLLRDFNHPNADVRFYAVSAVLSIPGDPAVLVPALVERLNDSKMEVRWNAVVALSTYHRRAGAAVPRLLEALRDSEPTRDADYREQLEIALWRIAPEQTEKALPVGEAAALVTNGVTRLALGLEYAGERRVLVPAGRTVPGGAQFWDSEPRGPLTLYLLDPAGTEPERLVCRFEVLGVAPPPASANVSLLCIVTEREVVLCARDNHSPRFLEIRRLDPSRAATGP